MCQIIEIAAVYDDTSIPFDENKLRASAYHNLVTHELIFGELPAIVMNAEILQEIKAEGGIDDCDICPTLANWLNRHTTDKVTFAGKNFANFDLRFLERLPYWNLIKFNHRILDVGSLYLSSIDTEVPKFQTCIDRAYLSHSFLFPEAVNKVRHHALDDAMDVVRCIRAVMS